MWIGQCQNVSEEVWYFFSLESYTSQFSSRRKKLIFFLFSISHCLLPPMYLIPSWMVRVETTNSSQLFFLWMSSDLCNISKFCYFSVLSYFPNYFYVEQHGCWHLSDINIWLYYAAKPDHSISPISYLWGLLSKNIIFFHHVYLPLNILWRIPSRCFAPPLTASSVIK